MFDPADDVQTIVDPESAAESAGLRYVSDDRPGIRRRKSGKGFSYLRPGGAKVSEPHVLKRIRALAIPPAWTAVWICPFADGHVQATGRDARRRKQYRYHRLFRDMRETTKYEHVVAFANALPTIRAKVREHMGRRGLPREKVLATVVHLLETTLIRVGNADYAKHNQSYGLTTLKNRHVAVEGAEVRFRFAGKSGKQWSLNVKDRRVAKIIKACQDLPGQELLQYVDDDGKRQDVSSSDVNAYLRDITGEDVTAKDFRTWAGTILVALALNELKTLGTTAQAKRNLRRRSKASPPASATLPRFAESAMSIPKCSTRISTARSSWRSSPRSTASYATDLRSCGRRRPRFWRYCGHAWRQLTQRPRHDPEILHRSGRKRKQVITHAA